MNFINKKHLKNQCGIYMIYCRANNKFYIGSAKNFSIRKTQHLSLLRKNKHFAKYLQHSWNQYGEPSFEFVCLELCPQNELIKAEQFYLNKYTPYNPQIGFNSRKTADSNRGYSPSAETRLKKSRIGIKQKGVDYELVDPNGVLHKGRGIGPLAKKFNLDPRSMSRLAKGEYLSFKEWRHLNFKAKEDFKFLNPKGEIVVIPYGGLNDFAKTTGMQAQTFTAIWNKRLNQCNGWRRFDNPKPAPVFTEIVNFDGRHEYVSSEDQSKTAKKIGIDSSSLSKLLKRKVRTVKGWALKDNLDQISKGFEVLSPQGEILFFRKDRKHLTEYCTANNLDRKKFRNMAMGSRKTYAGYINPNYIPPHQRTKEYVN